MPLVGSPWSLNRNFGVVIDAGSSGSRVQIYSWKEHRFVRESKPESELRALPMVETGDEHGVNWQKKIEPGISTFATNPELVGPRHLKDLLDYALDVVPRGEITSTPIYVLATAGMRLLPPSEQKAILEHSCIYIKENYSFRIENCEDHVRVITGEMEGIYGWLAVNYLMDGFGSDIGKDTIGNTYSPYSSLSSSPSTDNMISIESKKQRRQLDSIDDVTHSTTFGFLDMGGASAQIAFVPNSKEAEEHANDLKHVNLYTLAGTKLDYGVFVATFLGFGTNEARRRYVEDRIRDYTSTHETIRNPEYSHEKITTLLKDPCLPVGLLLTDTTIPPPYYALQGTGSFSECLKNSLPLVNKTAPCNDNPCLFNGVHTPNIDFNVNRFIGISEYWYSTHEVFGFNGEWDFTKFQQKATDYCSKHWNDIYLEYGKNEEWRKSGVDLPRLEMQCFKSAWLTNILHEGIGVPKNPNSEQGTALFQSVNMVRNMQVSWTLGKMVLESSNMIPAAMVHPPPDPQGRGLFGYYNYMMEWVLATSLFTLCCFGLWWMFGRKTGFAKRRLLNFGFLASLLPWRNSGPMYGILDGPNLSYPPHSSGIINLLKMSILHFRLYTFRLMSFFQLFFIRRGTSETEEIIEVETISSNDIGIVNDDMALIDIVSAAPEITTAVPNGIDRSPSPSPAEQSPRTKYPSTRYFQKKRLSGDSSNAVDAFSTPVNLSLTGLQSRNSSFTNLAKLKERSGNGSIDQSTTRNLRSIPSSIAKDWTGGTTYVKNDDSVVIEYTTPNPTLSPSTYSSSTITRSNTFPPIVSPRNSVLVDDSGSSNAHHINNNSSGDSGIVIGGGNNVTPGLNRQASRAVRAGSVDEISNQFFKI